MFSTLEFTSKLPGTLQRSKDVPMLSLLISITTEHSHFLTFDQIATGGLHDTSSVSVMVSMTFAEGSTVDPLLELSVSQ